jgi:hypothetical protein
MRFIASTAPRTQPNSTHANIIAIQVPTMATQTTSASGFTFFSVCIAHAFLVLMKGSVKAD